MKKLIALLLVLMLALSMAACTGNQNPTGTTPPAGTTPPGTTVAPTTQPENPAPSTAAQVSFSVIVKDLDGTEKTFQYTSSAATVGEALLAEGLIAGDNGDWGLMVTTVNGITVDWATENAYWAFYIDGAYAETGVDATALTEGATYSFVKTVSYTVKGEGETLFYFTARDLDGTVTKFEIHTNATTVGAALVELELIAGNDSDWGLYVTTVNGIAADWDTEKTYWAFYIDGTYAQTGVDATPVEAGVTYEMVKTQEQE